MKVQHLFLMFAVTAMCLTACEEKQIMPGDNDNNQKALVIPDPTPDPEGFKVPEGAINVYKAIEIAKGLKFGETTTERYLIKGYLTSFNRDDKFATQFPQYGNDYFYLSAVQPSDEQPINNFYAYRALGKYGAKLPDLECLKEGDFVVISCLITNYNGVFESGGTCYVVACNNAHFNEVFPELKPITLKPGEISVKQANDTTATIEEGKTSTAYYDIRGYVVSIDYTKTDTVNWGKNPEKADTYTFNMSDGEGSATAFRIYYKADGESFKDPKQVKLWDEVVLHSKIQNYYGTCEPAYGWMIESTNPDF